MPRKTTVDPEVMQLASAIKALRDALDVTQEHAAECADPPMTSQYWGMHETGKVPGIFKPAVQRKLLDALSKAAELAEPLTLDDLERAMRGEGPGAPEPAGRLARLAHELGPRPDPSKRRSVFSLSDGDVVIEIPSALTPAGFKQLKGYLAIFLEAANPCEGK